MVSLRPRTFRLMALTAAVTTTFVASGATAQAGAGTASPTVDRLAGWEHDRPVAGVDLYQGTLSGRPGADHWTVTVRGGGGGTDSVDPDQPTGTDLQSRSAAKALADRLRDVGFAPRAEKISWPKSADRTGLLGVRVRVGEYASKSQADEELAAVSEAGFQAVTEWTGGDGAFGTGETRIKVAVIDPKTFGGSLDASYGQGVFGREKVSDLAADSLLGVNAGFFVMDARDGIPGAPAGISAYDGKLENGATNGRVAAVLRGGDGLDVDLGRFSTKLQVRAGSESRTVDGVNRTPGKIRNCGGVGGDAPTEQPLHDVTCTDPDEIVSFTDNLGARTPAGNGVEAVLDGDGRVRELRSQGGVVPEDASVLAGIGEGASWLRAHAKPGTELTVDERIVDAHGREVRLGPDDDIVNGGPELVRDGKAAVTFGVDGMDHSENPTFAYAWGVKRNPRTLLGIDDKGRLIVVAAEGRQPGYSDGLGLTEAAKLMVSLGAVEAMNLDGGGSTAMTLDGELITRPSDPAGERAVGDVLLLKR